MVGQRRDGSMVTARDLKADGAMAALLRDALMPNLVQTLEGSPALVHGGPFANIAHGCNSVMATRLGLKLADVGGDGGGVRRRSWAPRNSSTSSAAPPGCGRACSVVVATLRALKMHGGVAKSALDREDAGAVARGVANLARHVENMRKFGLPVVVGLNRFTSDTDAEFAVVRDAMAERRRRGVMCTHWADGAAGAAGLARAVLARLGSRPAPALLYPDAMPLAEKLRTVAREIYRASDIRCPLRSCRRLAAFEAAGFGSVPVCIAKTQYSFSADPTMMGAPEGHILPVRDVRLLAGAGFVVAVCGDIMTMPGLPRAPAAETIGLDAEGRIEGLF